MRILFTTPTFHPYHGGAETMLEDIAAEFVKAGHSVSIFTSRFDLRLPSLEERKGAVIWRCKYPCPTITSPWAFFAVLSNSMKMLIELYRLIHTHDVICIGLVGVCSYGVVLIRLLKKFKFIIYLHGGEIRSYVKISRFMRWTLRQGLKRCDRVISNSVRLGEDAVDFAPETAGKMHNIPVGIDLVGIRAAPLYSHRCRYILFAGRLHRVKGVELLIAAFNLVATKIQELDLIIAGAGPEENQLKNLSTTSEIPDRIRFFGDCQRDQVYALLNGCQFLVLPSHAEGCPVVIIEAMAAGKMTIASRVKGISEMITHEENGILFTRGDSAQLASLIIQYHDCEEERKRIEANIEMMNLERYDIRKSSPRHLAVYRV